MVRRAASISAAPSLSANAPLESHQLPANSQPDPTPPTPPPPPTHPQSAHRARGLAQFQVELHQAAAGAAQQRPGTTWLQLKGRQVTHL